MKNLFPIHRHDPRQNTFLQETNKLRTEHSTIRNNEQTSNKGDSGGIGKEIFIHTRQAQMDTDKSTAGKMTALDVMLPSQELWYPQCDD